MAFTVPDFFFCGRRNFSDNRIFGKGIGKYIAEAIIFFESEGGFMNYLKRLGLVCLAIAFFMSISVITSYAQSYRNRGWENRDYNRQYQQNNRRYRRNSRITPQEYRRLSRERYRLYQRTNRYYRNDGYLSDRERRKLARKYNKYRRNVYRDRRDW